MRKCIINKVLTCILQNAIKETFKPTLEPGYRALGFIEGEFKSSTWNQEEVFPDKGRLFEENFG